MFSKSMYTFINSGIVGKSSSSNFMLHRPKNASIWSCMWPTKRKDTNASLKMPFATNNDHYAKTYLFLLSLAQLSDWTRIVGKFMAITGSLGGSGNECKHTSFPSNTVSYRGVDPVFSNNNLEEQDGGFSKSCKSLANYPIMWFESAGYNLRA